MEKTPAERPEWWPDWFTGKSIDESIFCGYFLMDHPLVYCEDAFFTREGVLYNPSVLKTVIFKTIRPFAHTNVPKKITSMLLGRIKPNSCVRPYKRTNLAPRTQVRTYAKKRDYSRYIDERSPFVMSRPRKKTNLTPYPDHVIEGMARCLWPDLLAFFESEEGQREFAEWKKNQSKADRQKAPEKLAA